MSLIPPAQIRSQAIREAAEIAVASGNTITAIETGWAKMGEVVVMKFPLAQEAHDRICEELPSLRHAIVEQTPYLRAEQRFLDEHGAAAISFPKI